MKVIKVTLIAMISMTTIWTIGMPIINSSLLYTITSLSIFGITNTLLFKSLIKEENKKYEIENLTVENSFEKEEVNDIVNYSNIKNSYILDDNKEKVKAKIKKMTNSRDL